MNSIAHINTGLMEKSQALSVRDPEPEASPWQLATTVQRDKASKKAGVVRELLAAVESGKYKSYRKAAKAWITSVKRYGPEEFPLAFELGNNGKCVSVATLYNWRNVYNEGGTEALLEGRGGSDPEEYDFDALALELWDQPTKPSIGDVVVWLRQRDFKVEQHQVRRLIERKGDKYSRKRMGDHYWRQNIGPHVIRDNTNIPVGHTFMGDGHTCDVYVAHPKNGKSWRPELTVWIDLRSHFITGWYISNAESAITTMACLSATIDFHDHVPAVIYVDPGSGFKNKIVTEEEDTSFCSRMGITPVFALPGNAKAKGLVEGWFRWFESRCGRQFYTHTSPERTDGALRNLESKIKRGEIILPTLDEYKQKIAEYVHYYNNNLQKALGCSPADLWAALEKTEPSDLRSELIKPHYKVTVRKGMIQRGGYIWTHEVLADSRLHKKKVQIAIDLNSYQQVTVEDLEGRFICFARLYDKKPGLSESFIEETIKKRDQGQVKRAQAALDKLQTQNGLQVTHDQTLESANELFELNRPGYSGDCFV